MITCHRAEAGRDGKYSDFKTYFLIIGKKLSLLKDNIVYVPSEMCLSQIVFVRDCKQNIRTPY